MADFYQILTSSLDEASRADADLRRQLYERARQALESQIASMEPPLPDEVCQAQRGSLAEAIVRIESEIAAANAVAPKPAPDEQPSAEADTTVPPTSAPQADTAPQGLESSEEVAPTPVVSDLATPATPAPESADPERVGSDDTGSDNTGSDNTGPDDPGPGDTGPGDTDADDTPGEETAPAARTVGTTTGTSAETSVSQPNEPGGAGQPAASELSSPPTSEPVSEETPEVTREASPRPDPVSPSGAAERGEEAAAADDETAGVASTTAAQPVEPPAVAADKPAVAQKPEPVFVGGATAAAGIAAASGANEARNEPRLDTPAAVPAGPQGKAPDLRAPGLAEENEEPRRRRRGGVWAVLAVLLLLLAGAGAGFAYWQPERAQQWRAQLNVYVAPWLGGGENAEAEADAPPSQEADAQVAEAQTPPPPAPASEPASPDPVPADPVSGDPAPAEPVAADPVPPPPATGEDVAQADASSDDPGADAPSPDGAAADQQVAQADSPPAPAAAPAPAPAQAGPTPTRGFMQVEGAGLDGQDQTYDGVSTWSFDEASKTLRMVVLIPDFDRSMAIDMVRNTDDTLSASHTLFFQYRAKPEDAEGLVMSVPGLLARTAENQPGAPFRGTGAQVVPGQYLMGLYDGADNVTYNMNLLKTGKWLVVPVLMQSNRRALLVLERGEVGEQAVTQALEAWGSAQ